MACSGSQFGGGAAQRARELNEHAPQLCNQEVEAYECSCSVGCICPGSVKLGPYSRMVPPIFKVGLSSVKPLW